MLSKAHANIEITLSSAIPKNSLALNVCLLVDVKLGLMGQSGSAAQKASKNKMTAPHSIFKQANEKIPWISQADRYSWHVVLKLHIHLGMCRHKTVFCQKRLTRRTIHGDH